jgi:hypothetical protein
LDKKERVLNMFPRSETAEQFQRTRKSTQSRTKYVTLRPQSIHFNFLIISWNSAFTTIISIIVIRSQIFCIPGTEKVGTVKAICNEVKRTITFVVGTVLGEALVIPNHTQDL